MQLQWGIPRKAARIRLVLPATTSSGGMNNDGGAGGQNKWMYVELTRLTSRTSCWFAALPYRQLLLSSKPQLCSLLYLSMMDGDTGFLSGRHVEWETRLNPSWVSMMDVSLHNQSGDRTLTDRMQIVNLYEMSWLAGTRRQTRRRPAAGVFVLTGSG